MKRRIQRLALNRGTAVHVSGAKVRYIWPCGCKKTETIKTQLGPVTEQTAKLLVRNWRRNGVHLEQCKKHPDWYEAKNPLQRLNEENPEND